MSARSPALVQRDLNDTTGVVTADQGGLGHCASLMGFGVDSLCPPRLPSWNPARQSIVAGKLRKTR